METQLVMPLRQKHTGKVWLRVCCQAEAIDSLTHIHGGGGSHVAHSRREKEKRIKALTRVHPGFWSSSVVAEQYVEDEQTTEFP